MLSPNTGLSELMSPKLGLSDSLSPKKKIDFTFWISLKTQSEIRAES